jgi:hypothetical protein
VASAATVVAALVALPFALGPLVPLVILAWSVVAPVGPTASPVTALVASGPFLAAPLVVGLATVVLVRRCSRSWRWGVVAGSAMAVVLGALPLATAWLFLGS